MHDISNNEQKLGTVLDKLRVTLKESYDHALEPSTKQQSSSTKWQASRVGRVAASHFGDVLLRCSLPNDLFINFFLMYVAKGLYAFLPVQLSHRYHYEISL